MSDSHADFLPLESKLACHQIFTRMRSRNQLPCQYCFQKPDVELLLHLDMTLVPRRGQNTQNSNRKFTRRTVEKSPQRLARPSQIHLCLQVALTSLSICPPVPFAAFSYFSVNWPFSSHPPPGQLIQSPGFPLKLLTQ